MLGWMVRGRMFVGLLGLVAACLPVAAAPLRKVYVDRAHGVSFSYPAGWLLNGDDDAATAKFRITSAAQPLAVVQLEGNFADEGPYKGTDFEAGAFAYVLLPRETTEECFATLDRSADAPQKAVATTWKGLPARRVDVQSSIAGTEDSHQMVAAYEQGRCYLFEAVIVSRMVEGAVEPLTPERWRMIRGQFAGVMQSVSISPAGKP